MLDGVLTGAVSVLIGLQTQKDGLGGPAQRLGVQDRALPGRGQREGGRKMVDWHTYLGKKPSIFPEQPSPHLPCCLPGPPSEILPLVQAVPKVWPEDGGESDSGTAQA